MNKYLFNTSIIVILIYLLFGSCAQTGSLSGGQKDSIPPIPIKFSPQFGKTNFEAKKVSIKFNEFFDLKDIYTQFIVSPPLEEKPEIKSKGKILEIVLNGELADNTTYNFDFNDAVADFTESNVLHGFQYVCSTSDEIDSLKISGKLIDAQTHEAIDGALVFLYKTLNDTTPSKVLPNYLAKTNKEGDFSIRNIAAGSYHVFALQDMNTNLLYDQSTELIAFYETVVNPSVTMELVNDTLWRDSFIYDGGKEPIDTLKLSEIVERTYFKYLPDSLELFMFDEDDANQFVGSFSRELPGMLNFIMNRAISKDFSIIPLNVKLSENETILEWSETKDSLNYWIKNKDISSVDTLIFQVNYLEQDSLKNWVKTADTLRFSFDFEAVAEKKEELAKQENVVVSSELKFNISNIKQSFIDVNQNIRFQTSSPLATINKEYIYLYEMADSLVDKYIKKYRASGVYHNMESGGLIEASMLSQNLVNAFFKSDKMADLSVKGINFTLSKAPQFIANATNDTIQIQFDNKDVASLDTLKFIMNYKMKALIGEQPYADTLALALKRSPFEIFGNKLSFELESKDLAQRKFELKFEGKNEGFQYNLIFSPKFALDIFDNQPDSLGQAFSIRPDDYYGNLILNLANEPENLFFILSDEKNNLVREIDELEDNKLNVDLLAPGNYKIRAFADANKNKKWDTGIFLKRQQPEKVFLFSTKIVIRSAWDTEEDWDFSE